MDPRLNAVFDELFLITFPVTLGVSKEEIIPVNPIIRSTEAIFSRFLILLEDLGFNLFFMYMHTLIYSYLNFSPNV